MRTLYLIGFVGCFLCGCAADDATCSELEEMLGLEDGKELPAAIDRATITACPQIVDDLNCWEKPDKTYCRYGLHYGPNMGGDRDAACASMAPADLPIPCISNGINGRLPQEHAKEFRLNKAKKIEEMRAEQASINASIAEIKAARDAAMASPLSLDPVTPQVPRVVTPGDNRP